MTSDSSSTPGAPPPAPSSTDAFFDSLRRTGMPRTTDRWIGGVAAGVARRLGIDPLIVRGILLVMTLFGGLGLFLYGVGWALLPEETDGRIHFEEAIRGRFDAALAGAIAFAVIGVSRLGFWWSGFWWDGDWVFGLGLIALIALVVVLATSARRGRGGPGYGAPHAHQTQAPPPGTPGAAAFAGPVAPSSGPPAPGATTGPAGPTGPTSAAGTPEGATWTTGAGGAPAPGTGATGAPGLHEPLPWENDPALDAWRGSAPGSTHQAPPPVAAPRPTPPPRPRVPGPGRVLTAVVFALVLLVAAGLLLADYRGVATGGWLTVAGVTLALLGLGTIVAGAVGRRSGGMGVAAVLVAIVAVPWAATVATTDIPPVSWGDPGSYGSTEWRPTSSAALSDGFDGMAAGELIVDLTDVADDPGTIALDDPVEVGLGAGELVVVVPDGMSVRIEASVIGTVNLRGGDGWTGGLETRTPADLRAGHTDWTLSGGTDVVLRSPEADTDPAVTLVVRNGFGEISIREESA